MSTQRAMRPAAPTQAPPARRILHTIVAAAGWLLFLWWWSLVLQRVDPAHVRFTFVFIAVTLVVCVAVTVAWALHNLRISKRRTARQLVPTASYEFKRDRLGRHLLIVDDVQAAPVVQIRLEHEGKAYRPSEKLPPRPTTTLAPAFPEAVPRAPILPPKPAPRATAPTPPARPAP